MPTTDDRTPLLDSTGPFSPPARRYFSRPGPLGAFLNFVWPYILLARINALIGAWLTFWPCAWGASMAAYRYNIPLQDLLYIFPFLFIGCTLMHSAACVINDILDAEVDRQVERTKNRPLAARVIPVWSAWLWLVILTSGLLAMLTFTNRYCAIVVLINLPIQFVYPLFKRFTYWPSLFLGITFSWGSLAGWSALTGDLYYDVNVPLYAAGVFWSFSYDVIYGFQDAEDDEQAGVKSVALALRSSGRKLLYVLETLFIATLAFSGYQNEQGPLFYIFTVGGAAVHVFWQVTTVDLRSPSSCFRMFYANSWIGWPMIVGLLGDFYLKGAHV